MYLQSRFTKLLNSRAEEMKMNAAKDLEPKLVTMAEEHARKLQQLREELRIEVKALKRDLQRANELKLAQARSELDKQLQADRTQWQHTHDQQVADARGACQLELQQVRSF